MRYRTLSEISKGNYHGLNATYHYYKYHHSGRNCSHRIILSIHLVLTPCLPQYQFSTLQYSLGVSNQYHMSSKVFGDLELTFTDQYISTWNDRGSGASQDGAFYNPLAPSGFFPLAAIAVPNYENPSGKYVSICVKPAPGPHTTAPLAYPTRYEQIWDDGGSGASLDGSCWRPIPPVGYVAMGDIFVIGYNPPPTTAFQCVRADLVQQGTVAKESIWKDRNSGARKDFSCWQINASESVIDREVGVFAVNSFVGIQNYNRPANSTSVVNNLRLPMPTVRQPNPPKPSLDSRIRPPGTTGETINCVVTVPFTAVSDDLYEIPWKVRNSPFYTLERTVFYKLVLFEDNRTSVEQERSTAVTTGVSQENSKTFSRETSVTVSSEVGIEAKGISASSSVSFTQSFGYSSSTAVTQFRQEEDTISLKTPPRRSAATWMEGNQFRLRRQNGTLTSSKLSFEPTDTATTSDQFPKEQDYDAARENAKRFFMATTTSPKFFVNVRNDATVWIEGPPIGRRSVFLLLKGLAGKGFSLESEEKPGHFLRHLDYKIVLEEYHPNVAYLNAATFYERPALTEQKDATSFEAVDAPGYFICAEMNRLRLGKRIRFGDFGADATWILE